MTFSVLDRPLRLALLVNAEGERWVTEFPDGPPPKKLMRGGRQFTTIMTMDPKHIAWAQSWLVRVPNKPVILSVAPNVPVTDIAA